MRRQALDIFVNRIASHPELKQSEDLKTFLEEDEEVWNSVLLYILIVNWKKFTVLDIVEYEERKYYIAFNMK